MRPYDFGCALARFTEKKAGGVVNALGAAGAAAGSVAGAAAKPVNAAAGAAASVAPAVPRRVRGVTSAAPAWVVNNKAIAAGLDPSTGLRPGVKVPAAPPPPAVPAGAPKVDPTRPGRDARLRGLTPPGIE